MTVGIVVVSHSRALADAAVALAAEMVPAGSVPVRVAAGAPDMSFGTDATEIAAAIQAADGASDGAGVVVLLDLGSAILSTQLALDLVPGDVRDRTIVSPAPLVEGLVVAMINASIGTPRERVAADASGALQPKQSQLAAD
ncbi:dihydroxyacetone kinase phosphoryl donor subunit DhaM [Flexivirga meconopsidis]|uniref:dihydroxyacetone kinase phosphoryl donor subunit DhaM n=1 Tax=Flexivirga meconopsidis TaxID=2977121 RepID=UPI00223EB083|nr:dihydroxyacetone kinase phosphoryl donor subunit DhaM [Flexivirga meconopsidis]